MAGFEDLIRTTLKKQGDISPDRRAKIYDSSRQALERMLLQNDKLDESAASVQRERLEAAIRTIEGDYEKKEQSTPIGPSDANPGPPPQPKLKSEPVPDIVQRGPASMSAERDTAAPVTVDPPLGAVEKTDELVAEPTTPSESYEGKALGEKRPFAKLLLWAIILAGIGTAIWWAINFGPALLKSQFDGSVANPKPRIETGSFVPEGEKGWVSIFVPDANPENIDTGVGGRAELVNISGKQIARLASGKENNTNIKIRIPKGVMETLRGKAATFEVTLAAEAGNTQQFALYCEFGEMGSCGRKRFRAKATPEAHIFDVLINDTTLGENEDAFIAINTDISASGKVLDLYSIRVRTGV